MIHGAGGPCKGRVVMLLGFKSAHRAWSESAWRRGQSREWEMETRSLATQVPQASDRISIDAKAAGTSPTCSQLPTELRAHAPHLRHGARQRARRSTARRSLAGGRWRPRGGRCGTHARPAAPTAARPGGAAGAARPAARSACPRHATAPCPSAPAARAPVRNNESCERPGGAGAGGRQAGGRAGRGGVERGGGWRGGGGRVERERGGGGGAGRAEGREGGAGCGLGRSPAPGGRSAGLGWAGLGWAGPGWAPPPGAPLAWLPPCTPTALLWTPAWLHSPLWTLYLSGRHHLISRASMLSFMPLMYPQFYSHTWSKCLLIYPFLSLVSTIIRYFWPGFGGNCCFLDLVVVHVSY